jgi:LTXXQ motif family protein
MLKFASRLMLGAMAATVLTFAAHAKGIGRPGGGAPHVHVGGGMGHHHVGGWSGHIHKGYAIRRAGIGHSWRHHRHIGRSLYRAKLARAWNRSWHRHHRLSRIHSARVPTPRFTHFPLRTAFLGWYGPLFWPYAYDDIFYCALWPCWYDDPFWAYGYGDIYDGIFSPYSYDDLVGYIARGRRYARRNGSEAAQNPLTSGPLGQMCGDDSRDVAGWPIEQMQKAVDPTPEQRAKLDDLGNATVKASQIIKSGCPQTIALTPTGRLDAMEKRLSAMSQALATVRPPLETFYGSLTDEQKARLNAMNSDRRRREPPVNDRRDARACGNNAAAFDWPTAEIDSAVHPTEAQRANLNAFKEASAKAAETIKASCPSTQPATPPARLAAMAQRIDVMLDALKSVRSALDSFYSSLSDEQKARFNTIGKPQTRNQG